MDENPVSNFERGEHKRIEVRCHLGKNNFYLDSKTNDEPIS